MGSVISIQRFRRRNYRLNPHILERKLATLYPVWSEGSVLLSAVTGDRVWQHSHQEKPYRSVLQVCENVSTQRPGRGWIQAMACTTPDSTEHRNEAHTSPETGTSEVLCTTQAGFCAQVWGDLSMALSAALSGMQFSSCLVPMDGNAQRGYNCIVFRVLHRKFTVRKWGTRHAAHCPISSKWLELWQQALGSTHSLT